MLRLIDSVSIVSAAYVAYLIRGRYEGFVLTHEGWPYFLMVLGAVVLFTLGGGRIYRSWKNDASSVTILSGATSRWLSIAVILLVFLFSTKVSEEVSRVWFFLWVLTGLCFLLCNRFSAYILLRKIKRSILEPRRIVVIGTGDFASRVTEELRKNEWAGYRLIGHLNESSSDSLKVLEGKRIDEVWLAISLADEVHLKRLLADLRFFPSVVRYVPDIFALGLINHGISEVLGMPMVDLTASKLDGFSHLLKGAEDYIVASVALIVLSPLMVLIALLIKIDSKGPVLFRQKRHGLSGKIINVFKFRTMKTSRLGNDMVIQAKRNDERVTRVGKFLRRSSLDELPQLLNVICGDMSIVGPRPHAVEHNEEYKGLIDSYMKRHIVKPGITGWAQINGFRGETDTLEKMEGRVRCDIYYIENWSILLDIRIMLLTLIKGMAGKNAY